jgi:tetratricopeptide (TPR) repeat protein
MMESFEFVFWEALKVFGLIVIALFAVKAVRAFARLNVSRRRLAAALYGAIVVLVALGARAVGQDLAAEVYYWTGHRNLDRHEFALAYSNGARAVEMRPGVLRYWQGLASAKFDLHQFESLLGDEASIRTLSPHGLDEDDLMRFAWARYFLGQYEQVVGLTADFIRRSPEYPKSYVLAGFAETGLRRYPDAERDFLQALKILPTQADAVEGLAHAYFLSGDTGGALAVLNATSHYSFAPAEQERFKSLKAFYEQ